MKPWIKLWRAESARFRSLPLSARMLAAYILKFVDDGAIPMGKRDAVTAVAMAIGADPSERRALKPAVQALLDHGYITARDGLLVLDNFPRYQERDNDARPTREERSNVERTTNERRTNDIASTNDRREICVSARNDTLAQNVLSSDTIEEREIEIKNESGLHSPSPTARRAERLRAGYLKRFSDVLPNVRPHGHAQPGGGGPWLDLARECTDDDVDPLLNAFFADDFGKKTAFRISVLVSNRVQLLASTQTLRSIPTAPPTDPVGLAELAFEKAHRAAHEAILRGADAQTQQDLDRDEEAARRALSAAKRQAVVS